MSSGLPRQHNEKKTVVLEIKGDYRDKVQVADAFKRAYQVLDRLADHRINRLELFYSQDFTVEQDLVDMFQHAAREALSYKDAVVFGRPVSTEVFGAETIRCSRTRAMVNRIHRTE